MLPGARIRPARAADAAGCRALLPDAFPAVGRVPELWVAAAGEGDGGGGAVVGAAAVAWVPGGFPVLLRVAEPWRRRGIGRALLRAAVGSARGETPAVRSWDLVAEGSAAAGLLRGEGFEPARRFLWFETDAAGFAASMAGLLDRAARRVPAGGRVVSLADAPASGVARLVAARLATLPHQVAIRLVPGARNGFDAGLSLVALRGEAVVGAMLCQVDGGALRVEVNAAAPEERGGWVNLLLLEAMARRGRAAGFGLFRFGCEPHVRDTVGLARRCGAVSLPDRLELRRVLAA